MFLGDSRDEFLYGGSVSELEGEDMAFLTKFFNGFLRCGLVQVALFNIRV